MGFEQRDNSGVLFKNKKKVAGDRQPDYKGNAMVNGENVELAAWIQESKKTPGMKYMSLKFQAPRQPQGDSMGEYQGEPERSAPPAARRPPPKEEYPDAPF